MNVTLQQCFVDARRLSGYNGSFQTLSKSRLQPAAAVQD
jgi:hypothetical protein